MKLQTLKLVQNSMVQTTTTKKGFTLIELLVVIAIIGILSSVVLVSLNTARQKARDAGRKSNLQSIMSAISLQSDAFNTNAIAHDDACTDAGWAVSVGNYGCPTALVPTYVPRLPTDTVANTYGYKNAGTDNNFCMVAVMETAGANPFLCDSTGCRESAGATIAACTEG